MTATGHRLYDGMSKIIPVLHGAAKAVTPAEFRDALYAVCPPRFPWMRAQKPRSVGMFKHSGILRGVVLLTRSSKVLLSLEVLIPWLWRTSARTSTAPILGFE